MISNIPWSKSIYSAPQPKRYKRTQKELYTAWRKRQTEAKKTKIKKEKQIEKILNLAFKLKYINNSESILNMAYTVPGFCCATTTAIRVPFINVTKHSRHGLNG